MSELLKILEHNPFFSGGLTLMVIGSAAAMLRRLPWRIWAFLERRLSICVEIPDRDPAFRWVQAWLAEHRYARRARDLSLTTTWITRDSDPDISSDPEYNHPSGPASEARFLLSPAPGMHLLTYRRRPLILYRTRRELQNGGPMSFQESLTLQLLGGNRSMVDDLLGEAHAASFPRTPGVSVLTAQNGCWSSASWQHKRPLASLVLAEGILEDALADLGEFYASGAWYAERGIPYRRGYLLYGPPGTGKTTMVLALAGELKLSVAVLSLSNKTMGDEALRSLVDDLPSATLLLIEDIDCVFKDHRSTEIHTGVTLSGLLNALDGVSSRDGRVLFMTTNHPERLDAALIRPGRVDRKIELGFATPDQARRLFLWFYQGCGIGQEELERLAERFAAQVPRETACMAAIQEHLLRHRRAPEAAAHEALFDAGIGLDVRGMPAPESLDFAGSSNSHPENGISGL
jgi:mitochondrial chaperone BCS1